MPRHEFSKEELGQLTEEELAGLEDDDVIDEGEEVGDQEEEVGQPAVAAADPAATAADDAEDKAKAAEAEAGKAEPEKKQPHTKAAPAETAAAPAAGEDLEDEPEPKAPALPSGFPNYEAPADAKQKLEAIEQQQDELAKKFDDGELTATEYREKSKPLEREKDELRETMLKASLSHDFTVSTWKDVAVPSFLEAHKEYGQSRAMWNALDQQVRELQTQADNPFDPAILQKAHEAVQADLRKTLGVAETKPDPKTPAKPAEKKRELPPSLATVPAADITEDGDGGEFAYLDRLADKDPLAFEKALEKLSDAKRDEYLAQ